MRLALQLVSAVTLAWTIIAPLLFSTDAMTLPQVKTHLLVATVVWFVVTPMWMGRDTRRRV